MIMLLDWQSVCACSNVIKYMSVNKVSYMILTKKGACETNNSSSERHKRIPIHHGL